MTARPLLGLLACALLTTPAHAGKRKAPTPVPAEPASSSLTPPPADTKPEQAPKISLPCDWKSDQSVEYTYTQEMGGEGKEYWERVRLTQALTVKLDSAGDPRVVHYTTSPPSIEGEAENVTRAREVYGGVGLHMELQMHGPQIVGLRNWPEMWEVAEPFVRRMFQDPATADQMAAALQNEAVGAPVFLEEPARLFRFVCMEGQVGQRFEIPQQVPSPLGGLPIERWRNLTIEAYDADAGTLTMAYTDIATPESVAAALDEFRTARIPPDADPALVEETMAQLPILDDVQRVRAVISTVDGWPVSVDWHRTAGDESHPKHQTEHWSWTRVP